MNLQIEDKGAAVLLVVVEERLDAVKTTAIELVRQLSPQDIFSIVRFSDRAESLVPAGTHTERAHIETRIQVMQAGGGTEIYQGLEAGMDEVRRYRSSNHINHLILITAQREQWFVPP